jgi:hypothetical protein
MITGYGAIREGFRPGLEASLEEGAFRHYLSTIEVSAERLGLSARERGAR